MRNPLAASRVASNRVIPNVDEFKAAGVFAGAAFPGGSDRPQIPITGSAFLSDGSPTASSAETSTDTVRFPWPLNQKKSESPYPLSDPTQSPATGTGAGSA